MQSQPATTQNSTITATAGIRIGDKIQMSAGVYEVLPKVWVAGLRELWLLIALPAVGMALYLPIFGE